MLASVTVPAMLLVLPAPSRRSMLTVPVPAVMVAPTAWVMLAAPASRCTFTTPLAAVSLAIRVKLPLSVVILALSRMDRPACKVKAPPLPPVLFTVSAVDKVMSLLACRVTAVPAFKMSSRVLANKVLSSAGLVL